MDSNYPVFVFPTNLRFYLLTRQTHKQILTIYNPCDCPVRFKVLCTAPDKYSVIDPDGSIGPQACVDVVVRHAMPMSNNCSSTDKFRIQIQDHTTKQVLGKRDIEAKLFPGEQDNASNDGDNFHSMPMTAGDTMPTRDQRRVTFPQGHHRSLPVASTNYIIVILGLVCIFALLLPTHLEAQSLTSNIPQYLHLPVNVKLVFAYVLGLVTMVIFKPQ